MRRFSVFVLFAFVIPVIHCENFLLYDVFQSEGFNLRRDVYMRIVNVVRLLRQPWKVPPGFPRDSQKKDSPELNWTLVLPPWGPLPHWFAASDRSDSNGDFGWEHFIGLQWSRFFDLESLRQVVPVIEFEDFKRILFDSQPESSTGPPHIDLALNLIRQYDLPRNQRQRGVTFCPNTVYDEHKISEKAPISLFQAGAMLDTQPELISSTAAHYECVTGDLEPVFLAPFLLKIIQNDSYFSNNLIKSIYLNQAESVIHGHWSEWSQEYWTVRRSMVFASHLRSVADRFRAEYLHSDDQSDRTVLPSAVPGQSNGSAWMRPSWPLAPALGGPYIAVHWRCGDFVTPIPNNRWKHTPSPSLAAKQIVSAIKHFSARNSRELNTVFLATDAADSEIKQLVAELPTVRVVRFIPSRSQWIELGPGGIAIVDQWICAHAAFFIGTSPSTFTFRIAEERTIMGFTPESTFNTLCASGEARYYSASPQSDQDPKGCESLTYWPMVLEPDYTIASTSIAKDEL